MLHELSLEQVLLIGFVAAVLAQIIKVIAAKLGHVLHKDWITAIAFVLSVALAFIWIAPKWVPTGDPMTDALNLVNQAGAVLGFATAIYNVLLEKVLAKLDGWMPEFLKPTVPG